jgi:PPM family protein phosphatase
MANHVELKFAAKTDCGLVRSQNEDSIAISPEYGFAVLADGMGGYNAGEVASSIATAVTRQVLEEGFAQLHQLRRRQLQQLVAHSIQRANAAILQAARDEPQYNGMGTTLVAAVFRHDKVTFAHVGDSRAYRLRQGKLTQITRDHSFLQEQIDAGLIDPELARYSAHKNLVTRAMGVGLQVEVEIHDYPIEPNDIYLLCSDGLSDMLPAEEISDVLISQQTSLECACDTLVQKANEHGGRDNISAILIRVESAGAPANGLLGHIQNWIGQGR